MKRFIAAVSVACVAVLWVSSFSGCSKGTATQYTCPMHPEIVTNAPGKCPKCQMELKPKA